MIQHTTKWLLGGILLLPAVPLQYGYPMAVFVANIILLIVALSITGHKKKIDLIDIAFGILMIVVLGWAVSDLMNKGIGGVNIEHARWGLLVSGGLILNSLSYIQHKIFGPLLLFTILAWLIWVLCKVYGHSYEELTYLLSYATGAGNISQIAMYASCTVLLFAINSRQQSKWMFSVLLISAFVLAWVLKSKLLFAVNILALIDYWIDSRIHRWARPAVITTTILGLIMVFILKPDALTGRISLLLISKDHIHSIIPFGLGLGQNATFFNLLFAKETAVNVVGVVDQLAFNEYLQATIEMGFGGLAFLALLTFAVWRGRSPWLALGWIIMAASMFPLQYVESGLLWIFCGIMLCRSGIESDKYTKFSIHPYVYKTIAIISLVCSLYFFQLHFQLFKADQYVKQGDMRNGLSAYEKLLPFWEYSPDFRMKYGHSLEINNNHEAAIIQYRYSMSFSPSYTAAIQLADIYFNQSQIQNAINYYELAHRLRPRHLYPLYRLVWCYYNTGNHIPLRTQYELIKKKFSSAHDPLQVQMLQEIETLYSSIAR